MMMKGSAFAMTLSRLIVASSVIVAIAAVAATTGSGWQKVYDARDKGLPKTAIEALEPIIADALANNRHAEAVKAICTRIAFEGQIEGHKAEERVTRLEAEIAQVPDAMKPIMQAILANWYWHYFQQNRWRFQRRTQTAEPPGDDITTWDLPRILAEIDRHFTLALAQQAALKATPIGQYNDLLEKGTVPDSYRPTLYDFIAHEALAFYQAGEQGAAKAEDAFEIADDSPIFAPVAEFLNWRPETTDTDSPKLKAVKLFQDLLAFHQDDADHRASADADLWRLAFGKNQAVGPEVNERYKAALARFAEQWADHEIFARAICAWASVVREEGDPAAAHELATRGRNAHPQSVGGAMCHNLIRQIEAKQLEITAERVWNEPWPTVAVSYKNLTRVCFRAVPYDFEAFAARQRWGYSDALHGVHWQDRDALIAELIARKPAAAWDAKLPPTSDFRERTEKVAVPKDLKPGFYFVLASARALFGKDDNNVSLAIVWVSDLALIVRESYHAGVLDGFVLDALTGEPVEGATVRSWTRDREGKLIVGPQTRTDANGLFQFTERHDRGLILLAHKDGQAVASSSNFSIRDPAGPSPTSQTIFFTDRSLYRPGQTIQYKGICHHVDTAGGNYHVLGGQRLTVVFRDPNNKEIARQQHVCNDYGAFSGSFTAPGGTLAGRMSLQVESGPTGGTGFNVEEYKRPKFQVELERPTEAAKLGEPVTLSGKATAYTGAAIGGAQVKWRVVREVRFPPWCWWGRYWLPPGQEGSQNIAHGTAITENDGAFVVTFTARPDLSVPESTEPTFSFTVHADVTDTTGETRSASRGVRAGYTALAASITADAWQTVDRPVVWTLATTTLDEEPQSATGTVTIHALKQPEKVIRPEVSGEFHYDYWWFRRNVGRRVEPPTDPANPDSWELGEVVAERAFEIDASGRVKIETPLAAGIYRAMVATQDRFGKAVTARHTLQVLDEKAGRYPIRVPHHFAARTWSVEPGETFAACWGTGYDRGRAFVELRHQGKPLRAFWTEEGRTQELIEQAVSEELRGGFTVLLTYVRENRAYLENHTVDVPWSNKRLAIKWETFRSKLTPGEKEVWTAVVTGPDAEGAVAEMAATLYDASLDQYLPHQWIQGFNVFRREYHHVSLRFENHAVSFEHVLGEWRTDWRKATLTYRRYPDDLSTNVWQYDGRPWGRSSDMARGRAVGEVQMDMMDLAAESPSAMPARSQVSRAEGAAGKLAGAANMVSEDGLGQPAPAPDLDKITARRNLNETAFFFPHLVSDADGVVRMEFTMPEALTEWKFMGFAHDRDLRSGFLAGTTVTAKDLMVEPNPPRFVREGDVIEFTVKVSNQSDEPQQGRVRLTFADARTLASVDEALGNTRAEQAFDVPAGEARTFSWRIAVPDGCDFLTYKAVGASATLSDGEEGYLPVLSRRILVAESLPLPIRGRQTKTFRFDKLLAAGESDTLQSQNLTVQMVSQPAWYAVMALPYLMEYPHECTEQVFNRLYANNLARFIAGADPKIRHIFDQWKNTPALDSPLEKNQDLKAVMIEETPWLRQAQNESQSRRNVGILFDANRLDDETARAFDQLAKAQLDSGLWPWFPGFRGDEYITLYITTGFGRLRHLGADHMDMSLAIKSLGALDAWMDDSYRYILKHGVKDVNNLNPRIAFYLYGRSFFLADQPIADDYQEALNYWLGQARKYWVELQWRQPQGHLAIGLKRFGDAKTPQAIMKSIKEHSVSNEEMGMFWRDTELSWWWYRAPIETQALMIEAFDEVLDDAQAVEDCKVWLLKQKQTQDWKTTKATADAVYGLLLRGQNMLASDALVEVSLGGETIKPENVEAGTGFYEHRFYRGEIQPEMGAIAVTKTDDGVSWGSVHWQYLEDVAKVTSHEGTPLKLTKTLYRKDTTKRGQVLQPVTGPLAVGDELVCRVELRVDRDMEYVHLKDQRGSGTEPVNVLSRTRFQDGLMYYESTRDTASHFFIHYLPKGVYVFEYSVRVQLRGVYQSGIASIQCMYAPEFNSHSGSTEIVVE